MIQPDAFILGVVVGIILAMLCSVLLKSYEE